MTLEHPRQHLGEPDAPQVLGLAEVAAYAGVAVSTVTSWRSRHADFPRPLARLKMGEVYTAQQMRTYLARHNYPRS